MSSVNSDSSDARERMLGSVPGVPALGRGPVPEGGFSRHEYHHPAAGWGAARSVGHVLETRGTPAEGARALFVVNQEDGGFDCPGCAWPDDPSGLHLDICENGVKHVTWELTRKQAGRDFFGAHTVGKLAGWNDYDLEASRGQFRRHRDPVPVPVPGIRGKRSSRTPIPDACHPRSAGCAPWSVASRANSVGESPGAAGSAGHAWRLRKA